MTKSLKIPFRGYWEILSTYLTRRATPFWLLCLLICAGTGLQLANPQILRSVIDNALAGQVGTSLIVAASAFILLALVQQGLGVAAAYVGENLAWGATNELREDLAAHCLSLDMKYHSNTTPGELIQRIDADVAEFSTFFSQLVVRIFANVLLMAGILVVLFAENLAIGAVFTVFAALTIFFMALVRNLAVGPDNALRDAVTELCGFLEERLAGTEDIRSSGAVSWVMNGLYAIQRRISTHWTRSSIMHFWIRAIAGVVLTAGFAGAFIGGYVLFRAGAMTAGTVFLLVYYVTLLSRPIRELTQQVDSLQAVGASVQRIKDLRAIRPTIVDGPGTPIPLAGPLGLEFQSVCFSYLEVEPVLKDVSFTLPAGRILGLLGRTGSGKTTIARLVFRLYEPDAGRILLQGTPLQDARLPELRARVALVTQDVQLFQGTVRENITLFDRHVPEEKIHQAISRLELAGWLSGLPAGLDTKLEAGGRGLSAGQAQLLAFTRVFLKDPGLIVLDEASSRLDPATETLVERAVDRLLEDRTAIVVAHRLRTVDRAHDILVLEEGAVAEHGGRAELSGRPDSRFSGLLRTGMEELLA